MVCIIAIMHIILHFVSALTFAPFVAWAPAIRMCDVDADDDVDAGFWQRCSQIFRNKVKGVAIAKGIAFPTCVSINECVTNNSPLESEASKHVRRRGEG